MTLFLYVSRIGGFRKTKQYAFINFVKKNQKKKNGNEIKYQSIKIKKKNNAISTLYKKTLEEKMETELDMQAIKEYENENSPETYTHEDLKKLLGLYFMTYQIVYTKKAIKSFSKID